MEKQSLPIVRKRFAINMSKKQQVFLLSAPLFAGEHRTEREEFTGFECATCCGNGWHWQDDENGERVKIPCRVCEGSGKLRAVVRVEWLPDAKG